MKVSFDENVQGPEGFADRVDPWSEDYGLTPQIDARLLGSGMYYGASDVAVGQRRDS